ncbi:MAG TPA: class I SAM-dependent methyltransferase, partial [Anaeromyxobacteraceae bacterium]|nr:class I SAM-dependent methyltransferase [Anaeromyxobacteraceae bacterium]
MGFYARHGAGDLRARYSFVEPLVAGRRVLELGGARATRGESALGLVERGAAAVLSVDDDPAVIDDAAARSAHPFVEYRAARLDDLPRRSFDLVLLADGAPLAADPGRAAGLAELLSPRGHLVTALAVPEAAGLADLAGEGPTGAQPGYEAFVSALQQHFPSVEIVTQAAAVGWVLAPAGAEDPELSIDGAASGPPEAAAYLAVCGWEPAGLDGMLLVTLPHRPLADVARAAQEAARDHAGCAARESDLRAAAGRLGEREAELARLEEEVARLSADLEAALGRAAEAESGREGNRGELAGAMAELERLRAGEAERRGELESVRALLAEKGAQAERSAEAAAAAQARLAELDTLARSQAAEAEIARNDLSQERADRAAARREAEEAARQAGEARARAEAARFEAEAARSGLEAARREVEEARAEAD